MTDINGNKKKAIYSFSRLSAFWQCAYQYHLMYHCDIYKCAKCGRINIVKKGMGSPKFCAGDGCECTEFTKVPRDNNAFAEYGGFVHELLEKFSKDELLASELLDEFVDNYDLYVTEVFPPNNFVDLSSSYYNCAYSYLENFDGWDYIYPDCKVLGVEQHFVLDFGGFDMQGFIDLILQKPNGDIVIVDHKSKKKFASKKEQHKYARQLYLYSKYVYDTYGKYPKQLVFNHFRSGEPCYIKFDMNDYNEAIQWASDTVHAIECDTTKPDFKWEDEYNLDDFYCAHLCNTRSICPYRI